MAKRRVENRHNHLLMIWLKFLEHLRGIVLLTSLLLCPIFLGYVIYYTFVDFQFYKSLIGGIMLYVLPYLNIKMQGVE